jgi:hypothetical protein
MSLLPRPRRRATDPAPSRERWGARRGRRQSAGFRPRAEAIELRLLLTSGVGHSFDTATPIVLDSTGAATRRGVISDPTEVDYYRIVAPVSGALTIQQQADGVGPDGKTKIDSDLRVYYPDEKTVAASNDDEPPSDLDSQLDSQVQFNVVAGQALFVLASSNLSDGPYILRFRTGPALANKPGNTFDTATPIALDATGNADRTGSITVPGELDVYRFTATVTGVLTARVGPTPGSALLGSVDAFDHPGGFVSQVGIPGLSDTSRFPVVAGHDYFVRVSSNPASSFLGDYDLSLRTVTDDFGDDFAGADTVSLFSGSANQAGRFDYPGDADVFRVVATDSGVLSVRLALPDNDLSGRLAAFDADGLPVPNVGRSNLGPTQASFSVSRGQTYYVRVDAPGGETGPYRLLFQTAADDFGNTFADAAMLVLDGAGAAEQHGGIDFPGDVDAFRFVAPTTGQVTVQLPADAGSPTLVGALSAFDAAHRPLAINDGSPPNAPNGRVRFDVVAGQTYFVLASAAGDATGGYTLSIKAAPPPALHDDFPDTVAGIAAGPGPLFIDGTKGLTTSLTGAIDPVGDQDLIPIRTITPGTLTVLLQPVEGSTLVGTLSAFSGLQQVVTNVGSGLAGSAVQVQFGVSPLQSYLVRVAGVGASSGAYRLSFSLAPAPSESDLIASLSDPRAIALDTASAVRLPEAIGRPGDARVFSFVAPMSGNLTIRMDATAESTLDSVLSVFQNSMSIETSFIDLIASDDDGGGGANSQVRLRVVQHQTYIIQAAGFGASTGGFVLTLGYSAPPTPPAEARDVALGPDGSGTVSGALANDGDSALFRFVAPQTGEVTIQPLASAGGANSLDLDLAASDTTGDVIAANDGSGPGTPGDVIRFAAVAGQAYFLRVAAFNGQTGGFGLAIHTGPPVVDDVPDTTADAATLLLDNAGAATQTGAIDPPGDVDVFRFVATRTGLLTAREDAAPGSDLRGVVELLDQAGMKLARDEQAGQGRTSLVTFPVVAGQTYFVRAAGAGSSTGRYVLSLATAGLDGQPLRRPASDASSTLNPAPAPSRVVTPTLAEAQAISSLVVNRVDPVSNVVRNAGTPATAPAPATVTNGGATAAAPPIVGGAASTAAATRSETQLQAEGGLGGAKAVAALLGTAADATRGPSENPGLLAQDILEGMFQSGLAAPRPGVGPSPRLGGGPSSIGAATIDGDRPEIPFLRGAVPAASPAAEPAPGALAEAARPEAGAVPAVASLLAVGLWRAWRHGRPGRRSALTLGVAAAPPFPVRSRSPWT